MACFCNLLIWSLWINRYTCPDHVNPAEFVADLTSVDYSSAESVYSSQKRIDGLVEAFSQQTSLMLYATPITVLDTSKKSAGARKKIVGKRKSNWWKQFWLLLRRAWMQVPPLASITHRLTQIFSISRFQQLISQCQYTVIFLRFGMRKLYTKPVHWGTKLRLNFYLQYFKLKLSSTVFEIFRSYVWVLRLWGFTFSPSLF